MQVIPSFIIGFVKLSSLSNTSFIGIENPKPSTPDLPILAVFIPITCPLELTNGPQHYYLG